MPSNETTLVKATLAIALCVASCTARGQTSRPAQDPKTQQGATPKKVKIIPWLELNNATPREMSSAVAGLHVWRQVTDTVIITTAPGRAWIYPRLRTSAPGMRIIPGLKTYTLLDRFDSLEGWREVAKEVTGIAAAAQDKTVVLENESVLSDRHNRGRRSYWDARIELDFPRLHDCLRMLPRDFEIWWYPSFVTGKNRPLRHKQTEALCRTVQETLNTRFIVYELAKPPARNDWWDAELGSLRDQMVRKPTIPVIYLGTWETQSGRNIQYWREQELLDALRLVQGDTAILYPGRRRWVSGARTVARLLRRSAGRSEHQ